MRTTINLPDDLYARLRDRAREHGRTVTAELEDAVRARLDLMDGADAGGDQADPRR
ncbi:MAG: FitA-like ribbon-helix-helix domain-containing protein [Dermatophilaceae bacterium]